MEIQKQETKILSVCKPQTQSLMSCLINSDALELTMFEGDLTIKKAFEGTMINQLAKADKKETIKTLLVLISRMNDHFNTKHKLNQEQMLTLALDLIDVFKYETIEDVMLLFKMARQGKIGGKIWKLDSNTIFNEWVPAYLEQKAIERENRLEKEKSERLKNEQTAKVHHTIADRLKQWLKDKQVPVKTKKTYYNNYPHFLKHLPKTCQELTNEELEHQIKLAEYKQLKEAADIYRNELKNRTNQKTK